MINLENIDAVMAQTGADYDTVRQALLDNDGDVDLAIAQIKAQREAEAQNQDRASGSFQVGQELGNAAQYVINVVQEIWEKGNASSLIIEKDGKRVLELSLTVSTIGLILAPLAVFVGLGAAFLTDYQIRIEMNDGTSVNVNEKALMRYKDQNKH